MFEILFEDRAPAQSRSRVPFPAMSATNRFRSQYAYRRGGPEPTPLRTSESLGLTSTGVQDASDLLVEPLVFPEPRFSGLEPVESRRARRLNRAACLVRRFQGSGSTTAQPITTASGAQSTNAPDFVPSSALTASAELPAVPPPPARPAPLTPLPTLVTSQLAGVAIAGDALAAQNDEPSTRRVAYKRVYTPSQVSS